MKPFRCRICAFEFSSRANLRMHEGKDHPDVKFALDGDETELELLRREFEGALLLQGHEAYRAGLMFAMKLFGQIQQGDSLETRKKKVRLRDEHAQSRPWARPWEEKK